MAASSSFIRQANGVVSRPINYYCIAHLKSQARVFLTEHPKKSAFRQPSRVCTLASPVWAPRWLPELLRREHTRMRSTDLAQVGVQSCYNHADRQPVRLPKNCAAQAAVTWSPRPHSKPQLAHLTKSKLLTSVTSHFCSKGGFCLQGFNKYSCLRPSVLLPTAIPRTPHWAQRVHIFPSLRPIELQQ